MDNDAANPREGTQGAANEICMATRSATKLQLQVPQPAAPDSSQSISSTAEQSQKTNIVKMDESPNSKTSGRTLPFPPLQLQWIPNNFTIPRLKPVVRSAVCAWISIILLVIPSVEKIMGQVSSPRPRRLNKLTSRLSIG